jgi:threonine synthase
MLRCSDCKTPWPVTRCWCPKCGCSAPPEYEPKHTRVTEKEKPSQRRSA